MLERQTLTPAEEWASYLPQVLRMVHDGSVCWNPDRGVSGGFERRGGDPITEPALLITLWKARRQGLIRVRGTVVLLTAKSEAQ